MQYEMDGVDRRVLRALAVDSEFTYDEVETLFEEWGSYDIVRAILIVATEVPAVGMEGASLYFRKAYDKFVPITKLYPRPE